MRNLVGMLSVLFFAVMGFATAQQGDNIKWNGEMHFLHTNPLAYLPGKQDLLAELREKPIQDPETGKVHIPAISTANWRGYVATWRVENDRLYLDAVKKEVFRDKENGDRRLMVLSILQTLFGDEAPVFADWYTGYLIIPDGEVQTYVHGGYMSIYEWYTIVTVKNGMVITSVKMDADMFKDFRQSQFDAYKKTDRYAERFQKYQNDKRPAEQMEQHLFVVDMDYYQSRIFPQESIEPPAPGGEWVD